MRIIGRLGKMRRILTFVTLVVLMSAIAACSDEKDEKATGGDASPAASGAAAGGSPAATDDPAVLATFQDVSQKQTVGALEITVQSAGVKTNPEDPGTWYLILGLKLTNTASSNDYEYDLARSLTVLPGGQAP